MSERSNTPRHRTGKTATFVFAALLLAVLLCPALAQDIRGLEACMAEKQVERRTGCLQANVEFLQQALAKLKRETQDQLARAAHDLANAKAEIAALKAALAKLDSEMALIRTKVDSAGKK